MKMIVIATLLVASSCSKPAPVATSEQPVTQEEPASAPSSAAEVRDVNVEPKRTAPSGKAYVTHLARGENAYLGELVMEPGAKVPVHRDATEEYLYVLAGGGAITIDGVTSNLKVGSAVYMPANAEVSFENGDDQTKVVQVVAGPEPAAKYGTWQIVGE